MDDFVAPSSYVWINGATSAGHEAKISVFDRGLLYGDGVYEGLRVIEGRKIFRLYDHLGRLQDSAKGINVKIPYSPSDLTGAITNVVGRSGLADDGHVRVIVTRGPAEPGLDPRLAKTPTVIIIAYAFSNWLRPKRQNGLTAKLSSIRRLSPAMLDPKIKSLNYLNEILAQTEAIAADCDTAILFGEDGYLAEASAANIFLVKDGRVYTPYPNHCLSGITRLSVMDMLRQEGVQVEERDLTYVDLFAADEVFITSTAIDVSPIVQVDKRPIAEGRIGKLTEHAKSSFLAKMRKESEILFEERQQKER